MKVGKESPQWAKDLIGQWIAFTDQQTQLTIVACVWYTDTFYWKEHPPQVRIFVSSLEDAWEEVRANSIIDGKGIAAFYIEEGLYRILETPKGLEYWTARLAIGE